MSKHTLIALAAAAGLGLGAAAVAQQMQHQGPHTGMMMGPGHMLDRIEGRLAFLKAELKITEAQTPAWNELAGAVRVMASHHNERMKSMMQRESKPATLIERVEEMEQHLGVRIEEFKQVKTALRKLYGELNESQKREADQMMLPIMGMGPMHQGPMMMQNRGSMMQ